MTLPHEWRARLPLLAAVLLLSACADTGGIASQARLRDAAAFGLPVAAPAAVPAPARDAHWWRALGDAQLDRLVDTALGESPTLKVAQARLGKAQAAVRQVAAADLPQLNAQGQLTRQKFSDNYIYSTIGGTVQENGLLQLNGSWALDFFGQNQAALEAALGQARAAQADAEAARVLLASQVARSYVQWARLEAQRAVAQRTLAQRTQTLALVRERVSAGLDTRLELRQSEGGLPEARQQIEALDEQLSLTRHMLDALVGQPQATQDLQAPALDGLRLPAGTDQLPADLLGRRADIAAARLRAEAATQDEIVARKQFYPNVNLTAFAGVQAIGFGQLLKSDSGQWGVGPAFTLPLFEGGRLRANLGARAADRDAAVESYNATVIDAVREVADQIASVQSVARQQAEQRQAQAAAEGAYDIATSRYGAGLGNYLQVLSAESAVLAQRRHDVDLRARALDARIALAHALGGGWQSDGPAQVHAAQAAHER